jgi:ubiquinone/menaquinone biosynthesis C-methylase UbiE
MSVNIDSTAKKYFGMMAANYETKRKTQERWDIENAEVEKLLAKLEPTRVLDVPCGTGRFIPAYDRLKVGEVLAVDVSDLMIALAKQKKVKGDTKILFICKDVRKLKVKRVDVSVCVRFLDLIDEQAMQSVVKKLMMVTQTAIICTIRFGPKYRPKSNTAEHSETKFQSLIADYDWKIAKRIPVFKQGWHILLLKPR